MSELGRRGGRRGGPARARVLPAWRRAVIARKAAEARWNRPVLVIDRTPRNVAELGAFVTHYGSRATKASFDGDLEALALRAVKTSRRDAALARMMPVFLWRVRADLDLDRLGALARRQGEERAVGYLLELAGRLGRDRRLDRAARELRPETSSRSPEYFFPKTARNPFEAMAAAERTPVEARRWGLLTGTPMESFADYFQKVRDL